MLHFLIRRGRLLSTTATGFALASGVASIAALAPISAVAQETVEISSEFQQEIVKVQTAFEAAKAAPGYADAGPTARQGMLSASINALRAAEARIANAKDRQVWGQFSYNIGVAFEDDVMEVAGLKAMLESGLSEPNAARQIAGVLGQKAYIAENFPVARTYFQQALELGSTDPQFRALIAESYFSEGDNVSGFTALDNSIDKALTAGGEVDPTLFRRGLTVAFAADDGPRAISYSRQLLDANPSDTTYADAINMVRQFSQLDRDSMLDLLRLMNRTGTYKTRGDFNEHIDSADLRRLPGEVVGVIDTGYASGILDRSDSAYGELRSEAAGLVGEDQASLSGLASEVRAGGNAQLASGTGDAFLSYGMAAEAEEMYRLALEKPGVETQKIMTRLGIALSDQGKFVEAQEVFEQVTDAREPIADLWSVYVRNSAGG